jgi:uncharacterized coiled-coil DUF342 family protein
MVDKQIAEGNVADEALAKIDQIKKAAGEFRENVAGLVKDMHVETNDWHFNVESHEKGVTVDVAVKLLITKKKK